MQVVVNRLFEFNTISDSQCCSTFMNCTKNKLSKKKYEQMVTDMMSTVYFFITEDVEKYINDNYEGYFNIPSIISINKELINNIRNMRAGISIGFNMNYVVYVLPYDIINKPELTHIDCSTFYGNNIRPKKSSINIIFNYIYDYSEGKIPIFIPEYYYNIFNLRDGMVEKIVPFGEQSQNIMDKIPIVDIRMYMYDILLSNKNFYESIGVDFGKRLNNTCIKLNNVIYYLVRYYNHSVVNICNIPNNSILLITDNRLKKLNLRGIYCPKNRKENVVNKILISMRTNKYCFNSSATLDYDIKFSELELSIDKPDSLTMKDNVEIDEIVILQGEMSLRNSIALVKPKGSFTIFKTKNLHVTKDKNKDILINSYNKIVYTTKSFSLNNYLRYYTDLSDLTDVEIIKVELNNIILPVNLIERTNPDDKRKRKLLLNNSNVFIKDTELSSFYEVGIISLINTYLDLNMYFHSTRLSSMSKILYRCNNYKYDNIEFNCQDISKYSGEILINGSKINPYKCKCTNIDSENFRFVIYNNDKISKFYTYNTIPIDRTCVILDYYCIDRRIIINRDIDELIINKSDIISITIQNCTINSALLKINITDNLSFLDCTVNIELLHITLNNDKCNLKFHNFISNTKHRMSLTMFDYKPALDNTNTNSNSIIKINSLNIKNIDYIENECLNGIFTLRHGHSHSKSCVKRLLDCHDSYPVNRYFLSKIEAENITMYNVGIKCIVDISKSKNAKIEKCFMNEIIHRENHKIDNSLILRSNIKYD